MALMINSACTACDICEPTCPNDAISIGMPMYVIDWRRTAVPTRVPRRELHRAQSGLWRNRGRVAAEIRHAEWL